MSTRKIARWEAEGLIDAATAARLTAWEDAHSRPLALWATIGIGVLAIGLGIVSVVAANWDAIPGTVRLAVHFGLLLAFAGALWWRGEEWSARQPWVQDGALFVLGLLGLTFFGHIGQVYQTTSPLWQPLALWLALFAPLILLRGQSWLTAALIFVLAAMACLDWAVWSEPSWFGAPREPRPAFPLGLVAALPLLFAPLGAWLRERSGRSDFWRRLEQLARAYALGGASLIAIAAGIDAIGDNNDEMFARGALVAIAMVGLGAAALVAALRRSASGRAGALVLAASALAVMLALVVSGSQLGGGIVFLALWAAVAAAALAGGWRRVFQIAVGVLALRLIILSFELASNLLTSGAGLILAGVLIVGVALVAVRVSRKFAPVAADVAP